MKNLSSLTLRLLSSLILIPVVIGAIYLGWAFTALISICLTIAIIEWINLGRKITTSNFIKTIIIGFGFLYIGFSLYEMLTLNNDIYREYWIIVFMLAIWGSDSGAYLFGKTIGGPKMSPTISPNKTWAGYAGALISPAIVLIFSTFFIPTPYPDAPIYSPNILTAAIFGLLIGISGQAGDLMISFMKRSSGVKDTGALIPGHGGILDRIDALLLALPVYLAYIKIME